MVIAIAGRGREVAAHFGHSDGCTVYSIENQRITAEEYVENPLAQTAGCIHNDEIQNNSICACRLFSSFLLHQTKVDAVVAGEIDGHAAEYFQKRGIKVITGVKGGIKAYVQELLRERQIS